MAVAPDSPPAFQLSVAERPGFLFVRVTGINGSLETTLAYWTAIAGLVRERKPRRLMVKDDMLGEPPSPGELEQLVQALIGRGFEGVRIAYVEADGPHVAGVEHGGIYAQENGYDVRVFGNEQQAELWLRYGSG